MNSIGNVRFISAAVGWVDGAVWLASGIGEGLEVTDEELVDLHPARNIPATTKTRPNQFVFAIL
jgi:hypothetical protein